MAHFKTLRISDDVWRILKRCACQTMFGAFVNLGDRIGEPGGGAVSEVVHVHVHGVVLQAVSDDDKLVGGYLKQEKEEWGKREGREESRESRKRGSREKRREREERERRERERRGREDIRRERVKRERRER